MTSSSKFVLVLQLIEGILFGYLKNVPYSIPQTKVTLYLVYGYPLCFFSRIYLFSTFNFSSHIEEVLLVYSEGYPAQYVQRVTDCVYIIKCNQ